MRSRKQVQRLRLGVTLGAVLAAMLVTSPAHATDEADALAAARKCAVEVNRVGVAAQVDCMDEVALADFKQLMLAVLKRSPESQGALLKRTFGESASFDEVAALPPADFAKRLLQRREAAAQRQKVATSIDILGAVKDGARVHVLVRERSGPLNPSGAEVAVTHVETYIKRDGRWRSELRGDVKQIEQMMRKLTATGR
jgi:hypothetical protein